MYTPNGRRHPNQGAGSRMNLSHQDTRAPVSDRNGAWGHSYSDERGDGRWPRGEHEGAYGAQHAGYIAGGGERLDSPDRWSRDLGRHQDRWSHGAYDDASDYGGNDRYAWGRDDRYGRYEQYASRLPSDERMGRSYGDERVSPGFDSRLRHGYGSERMSERFDTLNDGPSYRPSSGAEGSQGGSFGGSRTASSRREFFGKGPKGYARSDERIREEICERLSEGYLDASDIEVTVKDGEVTLSGTISDRRTKRLAEELADGVRGVKDIENRLKFRGGASPETRKAEEPKAETPVKTPQNGAASQSA